MPWPEFHSGRTEALLRGEPGVTTVLETRLCLKVMFLVRIALIWSSCRSENCRRYPMHRNCVVAPSSSSAPPDTRRINNSDDVTLFERIFDVAKWRREALAHHHCDTDNFGQCLEAVGDGTANHARNSDAARPRGKRIFCYNAGCIGFFAAELAGHASFSVDGFVFTGASPGPCGDQPQ